MGLTGPPWNQDSSFQYPPYPHSLSPKPQSWHPDRGKHSQAPQKGGESFPSFGGKNRECSDCQALPWPAPCFLVGGMGTLSPSFLSSPSPAGLCRVVLSWRQLSRAQPRSALVLSWVGTDKVCWDVVGSSSLQPLSSSTTANLQSHQAPPHLQWASPRVQKVLLSLTPWPGNMFSRGQGSANFFLKKARGPYLILCLCNLKAAVEN